MSSPWAKIVVFTTEYFDNILSGLDSSPLCEKPVGESVLPQLGLPPLQLLFDSDQVMMQLYFSAYLRN